MVYIAKITQQLCIEESNYRWLLEERVGRRHKNLSVTINEILKNYQYLLRHIQNAQKQKEIDAIKQKQAEEMVAAYKKQIKASNEMIKKSEEIVKDVKTKSSKKKSK